MKTVFELDLVKLGPGVRDAASHLYRQLRDAILDGSLAAGSKLPPTRAAAAFFGVSRNTSVTVYERLGAEGLVAPRHGSGTYVADRLPCRPAAGSAEVAANDPRLNGVWSEAAVLAPLGFWDDEDTAQALTVCDLRPAIVDPRLFPFDRLRQSITRQLRRMENRPAGARGVRGNQGNFGLRRAISEHVAITRALPCKPEDILVTSGAQQAFDLIARVLVRPGRTVVAVEDPGYPPLRVPFLAAGAQVAPVPVDDEGLRIDLLPRGADVICVCPSHHFPLGVPLSAERRAALIEHARETGAVLVEDDYDGEFRLSGTPLKSLRGAQGSDVVFYVGTFSKSMLPSLRVGFVVPPAWAMQAMTAVKNASDWHVSSVVQTALANFIEGGHLTRHVSDMRRIYEERRSALLAAVSVEFPSDIRVLPSYYGLHVTAVGEGRRYEDIAEQAAREGVRVHSLARYHFGAEGHRGLILGYGMADIDQLRGGVATLGRLLRDDRRAA